MNQHYIPFTEEMKRNYTILVPTMLPMHFRLIISVMKTYGYNMDLLESSGPEIAATGLKYVHNDTCYPAILVIGQFIHALQSGNYDPDKVALALFQTGGGCRASNYVSLLRKALEKAGYGHIPVLAISFTNIEKHPGFNLGVREYLSLASAILYGDLLMMLVNQLRPYETVPGAAQRKAAEWTEKLGRELGGSSRGALLRLKGNYRAILADFASIPRENRDTVRVGVVGEIFVKYSPLGNNNLEDFLVSEGAEVDVPGLLDFILYCVYNNVMDHRLYRRNSCAAHLVWSAAYRYLIHLKHQMISCIRRHGVFRAPTPFEETIRLGEGYLGIGAKMGEGWLLTSEMLELAHSGAENIVCTQPFGCLPNHICGKGMMKPIKDKNPNVNIVAIDYDPGATRVNQENRLKLMLANARRIQEEKQIKP